MSPAWFALLLADGWSPAPCSPNDGRHTVTRDGWCVTDDGADEGSVYVGDGAGSLVMVDADDVPARLPFLLWALRQPQDGAE